MKNILFRYLYRMGILMTLLLVSVTLPAQQSEVTELPEKLERKVPDSVVKAMQNQKEFRYANDPSYWKQKQQREPSPFLRWLMAVITSPVMKWLLYLLFAALIVFVLYQVIVVNRFFIFLKGKRKKKNAHDLEGEELTPDQMDQNIQEAIAQLRYRDAIRLLYLKTLFALQDKKQIVLHAGNTNRNYLAQMQKHPAAKEFRLLTSVYEYVWYGEHQPNDHQFSIIHNHFNQFISNN